MVCVLALVFAAALAQFGLLVAVMPLVNLFLRALREAFSFAFLVFVSAPFGGLVIYGAAHLAIGAVRFAHAFHRIEIRPDRVVVAGWFRRTVVEIVDLREIMLREHRDSVEVVLRAGERLIVCPAALGSRLPRTDLSELAAWLGEILVPVEVPVRHCRAATAVTSERDSG